MFDSYELYYSQQAYRKLRICLDIDASERTKLLFAPWYMIHKIIECGKMSMPSVTERNDTEAQI